MTTGCFRRTASSTRRRLQAAQTGPNPILIRVETRAGHGAGMPLSKRIEATVDQFAFMAEELHVEESQH